MATAQANAAAPLDQLLVDVGAGPLRRWLPGRPGVEFIASVGGKPRKVGRRLSTMVGELDRVALAWRSDQQIRFLAENLIEAISPSNVLLVNPASAKAVIDTGGASIVRGAWAFVRDLSSSRQVPRMVDPDALKPERNLALTPGAVVFRSPVLELIQYAPQTERVRSVPLLIVPPTINKFYVTDLAPGSSLIDYLVQSGGLAPLADAPGTYVSESCDFTSEERKGSGHDVGNTDHTAGRSNRHADQSADRANAHGRPERRRRLGRRK